MAIGNLASSADYETRLMDLETRLTQEESNSGELALLWMYQLSRTASIEPTSSAYVGTYLASIVDVGEANTWEITVDWLGPSSILGDGPTSQSDYRQTLVLPPTGTVLVQKSSSDPRSTGSQLSAGVEVVPSEDFMNDLRSKNATGTRYFDADWWVTTEGYSTFSVLVEAPDL